MTAILVEILFSANTVWGRKRVLLEAPDSWWFFLDVSCCLLPASDIRHQTKGRNGGSGSHLIADLFLELEVAATRIRRASNENQTRVNSFVVQMVQTKASVRASESSSRRVSTIPRFGHQTAIRALCGTNFSTKGSRLWTDGPTMCLSCGTLPDPAHRSTSADCESRRRDESSGVCHDLAIRVASSLRCLVASALPKFSRLDRYFQAAKRHRNLAEHPAPPPPPCLPCLTVLILGSPSRPR